MFLVEAPAVAPTGGLNTGLEVIAHAECIRLLACEDYGRRTLYYEPPHDGGDARRPEALAWETVSGQWVSVPA